MEKNWIEKIKEFIRKAMNKGFYITGEEIPFVEDKLYRFNIDNKIVIHIKCSKNTLSILTSKGFFKTNIELTKRDCLELDALVLSIEEYREDIAIEEFNNFFKDEDEKPKDINDLDEDD